MITFWIETEITKLDARKAAAKAALAQSHQRTHALERESADNLLLAAGLQGFRTWCGTAAHPPSGRPQLGDGALASSGILYTCYMEVQGSMFWYIAVRTLLATWRYKKPQNGTYQYVLT